MRNMKPRQATQALSQAINTLNIVLQSSRKEEWGNPDLEMLGKRIRRDMQTLISLVEKADRESRNKKGKPDANL
jgi:hypothetical protein